MLRGIVLFYAWSLGGGIIALIVIVLARDLYDSSLRRRARRLAAQRPSDARDPEHTAATASDTDDVGQDSYARR
ncbi:MAG TPA: hypothetical protein VM076_05095 [Gemmatimonadaceae bacterium]|nr:hypothetical protein [Gemmatimonadaceae bacterium]